MSGRDEQATALDPATAQGVLALLRQAVDRDGHTVVMVTHDPVTAAWADEALFLARGRVAERLERPGVGEVSRVMRALGRDEGQGVRGVQGAAGAAREGWGE